MSKELEALDQELKLLQQQKNNLLRKQARAKTDSETKYWQFRIDKFNEKINLFNYIKTSLQRLEAIDKAKTSEALESMKNMIDTFLVENKNKIEFNKVNNYDCELLEERRKDLESYKQALLKTQEQEKVLEIAFKKRIDLESFCTVFIDNGYYSYNYYEETWGMYGEHKLTEEEFDTVKKYAKSVTKE